jgi:hypothetical protein
MSNQPQSDHPGTLLFGRTLNRRADRSWSQSPDFGELDPRSASHSGRSNRASADLQSGSLKSAGAAMPNSISGPRRLQNSSEEPRGLESNHRTRTNGVFNAGAGSETPMRDVGSKSGLGRDPLLTVEDVAERLNVTKDWVWDHSSRTAPFLPVIRMGDGTLRYRASRIEEFIDQRERLTQIGRKRA